MSTGRNFTTRNVLLFRHQDIQKYLNVNNPDLLSRLFQLECLTQEQYDQLLAFGRTSWQKVNFLLSYLLISKCDNPLSSFIQSLKFTADYEPHQNLAAILNGPQTLQPPNTLIHTVTLSADALRAEKEKLCMLLDVHALLPLLNKHGLLSVSEYCDIIQTESKKSKFELLISSVRKHSDGVSRLVHCLQEDTANPSGHAELANLILDQQAPASNYTKSLSQSLKRLYLERRVQVRARWPPSHNQELLEPRLVEHNVAVKTTSEGNDAATFDYKSLFKPGTDGKPIRNVLVLGEPGVGKSKFCEKLLCEWGKDAVLSEYSLVFFIPLCMKKIVSSESLDDLLLRSCPGFEGFSAKHLSLGKGCLFVLDGWDEISKELHEDGSILHDIISFRLLPFASVIVTSRVVASNDLYRMFSVDRCLTIQGFSKVDVENYIKSNIEPAAPLIQQLEANPVVEKVCMNPLNCAIVCHLWKINGESIPISVTELYTRIIFNVVRREIEKNFPQHVNLLDQLETNPAGLWLWPPMLKLCNLAFAGLKEGQTVFTRSDLESVFASTSRDLPFFHQSLGLLQSTLSYTTEGYCSLLFYFTHQTFQEYLAARHIANLDGLKQVAISREKFSTLPSFQRVWQFYFGISHRDIPQGVISNCLKSNDPKHDYKLHFCLCAYEASDEVVDRAVAANLRGKFGPYEGKLSAYDCIAIAQTISHTAVPLKIMLKYSRCGDRGMVEIIGSLVRKVNVEKLHIPCADITGDSFRHFKTALPAFSSLRELDLASNKIGPSGALVLTDILEFGSSLEKIFLKNVGITRNDEEISTRLMKSLQRHKQLTELVLSGNYVGVAGVKCLATSLECLQHLKVLRVREVLEGSPLDETALAALLDAVASHCPNLTDLDISGNFLSLAGAKALGKALAVLKSPRSVWANKVNIGDQGIHKFADCVTKYSLHTSHIISHLEMLDNDLHAEGILHLVEVITAGSLPVARLYLGGNPLGPEGASQIARMLESENCPLLSLGLSRCDLGSEGAILLLRALSNNTSLDDINIMENRIGEADRTEVSAFIHRLLQSSDTVACEPATVDLKWLCNFLKCNNRLGYLRISNNSFTGDGIEILLAFLFVCQSLELLWSFDCHITSHDLKHKGLQSFEQDELPALFKHGKLVKWRLEDNKIEEDASIAFHKLVRSACPRLKHILLRGNPIYHSQEAQGFKLENTFKWKYARKESSSSGSKSTERWRKRTSSRMESQSSDGSGADLLSPWDDRKLTLAKTDSQSSLLEGRSLSRQSSYDDSKLRMLRRKDSVHSSFDGELSRMSSRESQISSDEKLSDILKEQDLYVLLTIMKPAAPQWKEIGLALGFLYDELITIEQKPLLIPQGSTGYIAEMLNKWLKWAPPKHEWPTLSALAVTLRESGYENLAAKLRRRFNQQEVDPPQITQHPEHQVVATEERVTFSIKASGDNLTFQWLKDGIEISDDSRFLGSGTHTLNIVRVTLSDHGYYKCLVKNDVVEAQSSNSAQLLIFDPKVTRHPDSQPIAAGTEVTFIVETRGYGLTFQWQKDGSDLRDDSRCRGTNTDTLRIQQVKKDDEGYYRCLIENNAERKSSGNAQLTVFHPPRITQHPKLQTAATGANVTFRVEASGDALNFQWQKDGSSVCDDNRIHGTGTKTLSIQSVKKSDEGCYRCLVENAVGSKPSSDAELSVFDPPQITQHPEHQVVATDERVTFSIKARGDNLTFQWLKDGIEISDDSRFLGSGTHTLNILHVTLSDHGYYKCLVKNDVVEAQSSNSAQLLIFDPKVTPHPDSQPVATGKEVTFMVKTAGSGLTFQWQKDGRDLRDDNRCRGTNADTLHIQQVKKDDDGNYRCLLQNKAERKLTGNAQLTVFHPPRITQHPKHQTVETGRTVTFSVKASGDALKFQWKKDGIDLGDDSRYCGTDTSTLRILSVKKGDVGSYRCFVENAVGTKASNDAELTLSVCTCLPWWVSIALLVLAVSIGLFSLLNLYKWNVPSRSIDPPRITRHPKSLSATVEAEVTFTMDAEGDGLTFQWQKDGNNLYDDNRFHGTDTNTLSIQSVKESDGGYYTCLVRNDLGSKSSRDAKLSVSYCHRIQSKQDLYKSLAELGWWEALCENLGVEAAILNNLRYAQMESEEKKRRCLQAFYKQGVVCWESVVKVVMDDPFYDRSLAQRIAEKYGVDQPTM